MGIDRPDDAEVPRDKLSDHPADRARAETRYRQEYDADLRATAPMQKRTEPVGRSEPGARSKPGEPGRRGARSPRPGPGTKVRPGPRDPGRKIMRIPVV